MNRERIKNTFTDYANALQRLDEALREDPLANKMAIDGTIQRFEFTFELAWKLAKRVLEYMGLEVKLPRLVIKEAFQKEIIKDGQGWLAMLEDRNKTTHIYDEAEALSIYTGIKESHYPILLDFKIRAAGYVENMKE